MKRLTLIAGLTAMTIAMPAMATDINSMTDNERAAFQAEVRAYILENPEIIMEAVAVLEERQAAAQANNDTAMLLANADEIFNDGVSFVGGNPDGDITLVEFSDYRCPYCKKARPEIEALVKSDGNIRLIYKEFPILGPDSLATAQFTLAVLLLAPEYYEQASAAMMSLRGKPNQATFAKLAEGMGLDSAAILAKMPSHEVAKIIQANRALGQKLQISGTPSFILGDQMLRGYLPMDAMQNIVKQVRQEK
jgi:protein-disulfide isomerase